ncbi:MAG: hypothetical protein PUA56_02245 [Bacillales bacterium]|nr:hypothetical protein [Bacillales bacterium]
MKLLKKIDKFLAIALAVIIVATIVLVCLALNSVGGGDKILSVLKNFVTGNYFDLVSYIIVGVGLVLTVVLIVVACKKKTSGKIAPLSWLLVAVVACVLVKKVNTLVGYLTGENVLLLVASVAAIVFTVLLALFAVTSSLSILLAPKPAKAVEEKKEEAPAVEETPVAEEAPVVEENPVVEEEPVVEEAPVAEEDPVVEETPVEEAPKAPESLAIIGPNGEKIYINRTFNERLYAADPALLKQYSDLKNVFLSYRKVHSRVTKTNDAFRFEGKLIGKVCVAGKGLKVYLALDPLSVDSAIYHQRDASSKKRFVDTPLVVKVKSPLSYRKAVQLITLACEKVGTVKKTRYEAKDWSLPQVKEDKDKELVK